MELHDKLFDLVVGDDNQTTVSVDIVLKYLTFLIDPVCHS